MEDTCCTRKKVRDYVEKRALTSRVNRIAGQMNGVGRMIEEDRYCGDILTQLAAIEKAIKSLAAVVLESHLKSCVVEDIQNGDVASIDEVVDFFKRFE